MLAASLAAAGHRRLHHFQILATGRLQSGHRGKIVPMTKSEVRAIITSKLRLRENSRLLEIGSGTGSVTVEAALAAYALHGFEPAVGF
mgnify:CR=1 FL=1